MSQPGQWGQQPAQPDPRPTQPPAPQGYRPPAYGPPGEYGHQPGPYPQHGGGGYPPQGYPPGFPPQGPQGTPPRQKSAGLIVGIVVAAVVALVAIGLVAIAFSRGSSDVPGSSITPDPPSSLPSSPTGEPSAAKPSASPAPASPKPSASSTGQPGGTSLSLGNGITLTPASGWTVRKKAADVAQLSDGDDIFLGQSLVGDKATNPGQLCTAWHKQVAQGTSGGTFAEPKTVNLGSARLKGASCAAEITVSNGQGTSTVELVTVASVRTSDGVTVLGTVYFTSAAPAGQLDKDYSAMVNSMLASQARG